MGDKHDFSGTFYFMIQDILLSCGVSVFTATIVSKFFPFSLLTKFVIEGKSFKFPLVNQYFHLKHNKNLAADIQQTPYTSKSEILKPRH